MTGENLIAKEYGIKAKKPNVILFTAFVCLSALMFFVLQSGFRLHFTAALLPYALGFAAAYGSASLGAVSAIRTGPLSVTTLIGSYSLLIPTLYGVLVLRDPVKPTLGVGLATLLVSLFLINFKKDESMRFRPIWLVYMVLYFVGNGMCSTVQKMQQVAFDGAYKNEFMILALAFVSALLFISSFLRRKSEKDKKDEKEKTDVGACVRYGAIKGVLNGILNYLVMVTSALLPNAVLFPCISAGGIVLTFLCALTVYREKLTGTQLLGYLCGLVSVVLLNL